MGSSASIHKLDESISGKEIEKKALEKPKAMKHHRGSTKTASSLDHSRPDSMDQSAKVYIDDSAEGMVPCCEILKKKLQLLLPTSPLPSPMNTARRDMNTSIITIPASSLDCPSLNGKGLSLVSPINTARNSPVNSGKSSPMCLSRRNSVYASSPGSPTLTPSESRRNSQMSMDSNKTPIVLPTIHSALNFSDIITYEEDDYCVGYSLYPEPTYSS